MVVAVSLTLFSQGRDLDPVMKEIQPTSAGLTAGMRGATMPASEVIKEAEKLQKLFTEVNAFMKGKNLEKGAGWASEAATAASDLAKAAKANDYDSMMSAQKVIAKSCGTCHAVHREQLPDKTFKLKAP